MQKTDRYENRALRANAPLTTHTLYKLLKINNIHPPQIKGVYSDRRAIVWHSMCHTIARFFVK